MTGATGAVYGVRILQVLRERDDWESHLVISRAGVLNLKHEMDMNRQALYEMADVTHDINDIAASIASPTPGVPGLPIDEATTSTINKI